MAPHFSKLQSRKRRDVAGPEMDLVDIAGSTMKSSGARVAATFELCAKVLREVRALLTEFSKSANSRVGYAGRTMHQYLLLVLTVVF